MEGWRKYRSSILSEEFAAGATGPAQANSEAGGLSPDAKTFIEGHDLPLEDFVSLLKQVADDPSFRALALAGRKDDGGPPDEAVTVTGGTPIAAKDLTPTQKEIEVNKSLGDQMTNKFGSTAAALNPEVIHMPGKKGPTSILTYQNTFILDGHHRWSQIMMTNPEGMVAVQNLGGTAIQTAEAALKATQLAIAGLAGNVLTKGVENNLLNLSADGMRQIVNSNISDEVLELLVKMKKISKPDKAEAAEYYVRNLKIIQGKPPGAFSREGGMPQAGDSGVSQDKVNDALESGMINFDDPEAGDIQAPEPQKPQTKPEEETEEEV